MNDLSCPTMSYFSSAIVQVAISDWFIVNGITMANHEKLQSMVENAPEDFFELISNYVENVQ